MFYVKNVVPLKYEMKSYRLSEVIGESAVDENQSEYCLD